MASAGPCEIESQKHISETGEQTEASAAFESHQTGNVC